MLCNLSEYALKTFVFKFCCIFCYSTHCSVALINFISLALIFVLCRSSLMYILHTVYRYTHIGFRQAIYISFVIIWQEYTCHNSYLRCQLNSIKSFKWFIGELFLFAHFYSSLFEQIFISASKYRTKNNCHLNQNDVVYVICGTQKILLPVYWQFLSMDKLRTSLSFLPIFFFRSFPNNYILSLGIPISRLFFFFSKNSNLPIIALLLYICTMLWSVCSIMLYIFCYFLYIFLVKKNRRR